MVETPKDDAQESSSSELVEPILAGDPGESGSSSSEESLHDRWPSLSSDERKEIFQTLSRPDAEDLFLSLSPQLQSEILANLPSIEQRSWVRLLPPDDAADLIQEFSHNDREAREHILGLLDDQTRREVTALLAYSEDEAGGLMSSRYVRLRPDMLVDEAIAYLRAQARTQVETIYYAYVLDADQKLLGVVSFRELFMASPRKRVRDIMSTELVSLPEEMHQEEVSRIFSQQDLMAIPVLDNVGRIKGIVTVDDMVDVVQEEATEDMQKLGGMETLEGPYLQTSMFEMVKKRAGWLVVLFIGEMFTATAMGYYDQEIKRAVVLALFIPLIISSGGNSGSQATSLIIRALALREVRLRDWWRVFSREIFAGAALGVILGLIGMMRILLWPSRDQLYGPHYLQVALTVGCALVGVVLWGSLAGSMLPFILRRLGFDPATSSAPFVATIVDVTGLVIYFTVASAILSGSLL